jgi:sugar lactone lactonase YvrE
VRLEPRRWTPPPAPPRARQRSGPEPFPPVRYVPLPATAEDVVADAAGRVYAGLGDGRIVRIDGRAVTVLGDTGGVPLGLEALPDGRLLVCDSRRGLLRLDPVSGNVETLVAEVDGEPLRFCSNAAAAPDGTVWFTESTRRWGLDDYTADVLEHSCTGRLLRLDPDGAVATVVDGLSFANGVALGVDGTFLVVAQTTAYELTKVPLDGSAPTPLAANLPGFPDNIARGPSGLIWVAMASPRDRRLDLMLPRAPWLRRVVHAVPERFQARARTMWVMAFDDSGKVVRDLQGPGEKWAFATGVAEVGDELWLASLSERSLAVLSL